MKILKIGTLKKPESPPPCPVITCPECNTEFQATSWFEYEGIPYSLDCPLCYCKHVVNSEEQQNCTLYISMTRALNDWELSEKHRNCLINNNDPNVRSLYDNMIGKAAFS